MITSDSSLKGGSTMPALVCACPDAVFNEVGDYLVTIDGDTYRACRECDGWIPARHGVHGPSISFFQRLALTRGVAFNLIAN